MYQIFCRYGSIDLRKNRANSRSVSWTIKALEFFRQLIIELKKSPKVHSVNSFVHWFKIHCPNQACPSTPTVYRYIDDGQLELTNSDLSMKLRRQIKSSRKAHKRISSEPAIMTLTDRKNRYEIIVKIKNYHADTYRKALQKIIDDYGPQFFKTVTFDNGSEFANLSKVTGTTVYFAHPYYYGTWVSMRTRMN